MVYATLFALLLALCTTCCLSKKCQHKDEDRKNPPAVPHLTLNDSFINGFQEVIVIGDIHGCLDELQALLKSGGIESNNVLKIITGDLVRKGPKSRETLEFVRNSPSILTVRGNNDENALLKQGKKRRKLTESDQFIADLSQEELDYLSSLPYSISIPSTNIIVVHAGLLPGVALEDNNPYDIMNLRNLQKDDDCPKGYKPKKSLKNGGKPWAAVWDGPQHVIFGHDRKRALQAYPYATGIDTACVYGNYLTGIFIKGPRAGIFIQQNSFNKYF